jgi:uncharacterized phage infection (PIP) family protein YhgE
MWDFLKWLIGAALDNIDAKLAEIIANQRTILLQQAEIKETIMAVKQTAEALAAQVNAFSNALATAVATIAQQLADLNARLVDASTPEEVEAIMAVPLANLGAVTGSLVALAAGNQPVVPDVPPVEPLPPVEPVPPEEPL